MRKLLCFIGLHQWKECPNFSAVLVNGQTKHYCLCMNVDCEKLTLR